MEELTYRSFSLTLSSQIDLDLVLLTGPSSVLSSIVNLPLQPTLLLWREFQSATVRHKDHPLCRLTSLPVTSPLSALVTITRVASRLSMSGSIERNNICGLVFSLLLFASCTHSFHTRSTIESNLYIIPPKFTPVYAKYEP